MNTHNVNSPKKHNMTDEHYMRRALEEAHAAADRGEVPVGAVVVCRDTIIARGHNLTENAARCHCPCRNASGDGRSRTTRGEKYLNDCTLYVTVEPCVMCAGALGWSQISRVVYGAADPKRGFSVYAPQALHPKTQVTSGVLAEECGALMSDFFKRRR